MHVSQKVNKKSDTCVIAILEGSEESKGALDMCSASRFFQLPATPLKKSCKMFDSSCKIRIVFVYYCSATNMSNTITYTTKLPPTCPLPYRILLFSYQHGQYHSVHYYSTTNMTTTIPYTTLLLPAFPLPDCIILSSYGPVGSSTVVFSLAVDM